MPTTSLPTGSICVVRTPDGEAPLWVRRAWVGIVLPCDPYEGAEEDHGVLSGKPSEARSDFSVLQKDAIGELEGHNPEAAAWWKRKGFPKEDQCFGFSHADSVILSGVRRRQINQVTDEMMGDRFR